MNMFENYNAHMITNAYLLDKAKSQKLKELKISAIQVTIDGLEKVHNERRPHKQNNDSFQRIVHNLDDLFSVYPEISIEFRVNVDKSNQSEYHRIYNYLKERYGNIASTSILDTSPMTFPQNQMAVVLKQTKSISLC